MFSLIFDFQWSKFRFLINIAQTLPTTINFRELNICEMALYLKNTKISHYNYGY